MMTKAEREAKNLNKKEEPKHPRQAPQNSHPMRAARVAAAKLRRGEDLSITDEIALDFREKMRG